MRTPSFLLAAAVAFVAGCQDGKYRSKDDPHGNIKVPTIENSYEMVGVGKPPLTFITTTGGWIKIVDSTENTLIHTAQIPPSAAGALLRVDPDARGITIGPVNAESSVRPSIVQPIDPSHRFEIYYQR